VRDPLFEYFLDLPNYALWGIWLERNKTLFKGKTGILELVAHKIKVAFKEIQRALIPKVPMHINALVFNQFVAWIYFDSVSQGYPAQCGVGMVLFLS
jgi:hypothetical protein